MEQEYPRLQKTKRMLGVFNRAITEAERQGDPQLMFIIAREGPKPQIEMRYSGQGGRENRVNLAEELGLSSGETISLFGSAEAEGYIRPNYGRSGRSAHTPIASLDHLESKGYVLIGELPDPTELLLQRLEAMQTAIGASQDLPPEQKRQANRALEELKHFLRGLPPGVAVEVGSAFFRGIFGG